MVVLLHLDFKKNQGRGRDRSEREREIREREREREREIFVLVITFITQLVACSLFFESAGVSWSLLLRIAASNSRER